MINILIIAYEFPPLNSGGSHRPYKFAKNLSQFGIEPIVITPKITAHQDKNIDKSLMSELENCDFKIIHTEIAPPQKSDKISETYYFNILDIAAKKWKKHLFTAIEEVLKTTKIDALYVTAPPFSMAALGAKLSKYFKLPLILDMRDAWSNWCVTPFVSYLHYQLTRLQERKALSAAAAIIATSDQTLLDFQQLHPNIAKERFHLITNAFDATVPTFPSSIKIAAASREKPLKIGYVGSFYYTPYQRSLMFNPWWKKKPYQFLQYTPRKEDWLYRSPFFFFGILAALKAKNAELAQLLKIEFAGAVPDWLPDMIKSFGLEDLINLKGRMSHKDALEFQAQCDLLLITSSKVINGQDYSIAGKTFEYICMKKPILALLCEGAQKRLLKQTGLCLNLDPDDIETSAALLENLIQGNLSIAPNQAFISTLHIEKTTSHLADIIRNV
jgi:hypothetical protein